MSDREMRAYFLPTFQAAIEQGAATVMINSGEINGTPVHINHDILTKLLRDELHFKGVAVTDWEDIYKLVNVHHVAATKKEAVKLAILAGVDMSMTPNDFEFTELLVELIKEGSIPMARIDESVRRILQLKKDLGLFTPFKISKQDYPDFASKKHTELSYQAAAESITLLKNTNAVLPITKRSETILVCGPAANSMNLLNGAWTHTWQGTDSAYQTPGKLSIVEAMKKYTKNKILYAQGSGLDKLYDVDNCLRKAQEADKIVICLGEMPSTEIPGNIKDLDLSQAQIELVKKLKAVGKPIILVCTFNRPRIIHEIVPMADAIVYAYLPGDEGGRAIADVISGEINPSGKLPFTYPAASNDIVHYDRKHSEDLDTDFSTNAYKPEFDFGFGLSYTSFEYSNLRVSKDTFSASDVLMVSVDVENTGKKEGMEVVQLYYQDLYASITPSVRQLCAYDKINLKKGEKKTVSFVIKAEDLSFINKQLLRVTERGDFELYIQQLKHHVYYQ
jgi:beta-glucosidase